jgi:uncharacterized protein DUF6114
VIADCAGSGNSRVEQRPAPRFPRKSLTTVRRAFRIWRRTRPFWGGLLVIVGASEMLVAERDPLPVVTHIGIQGVAGYLIPAFILLCGLMLWLVPIAWIYYSVLTIMLALGSWITSNLGGFFIGMLIDMVGGALAFAWTTDGDDGSSGWWIRSKPRIAPPSWAPELVTKLQPSHLATRSTAALDWQPVERAALPAPQTTAQGEPYADRRAQE